MARPRLLGFELRQLCCLLAQHSAIADLSSLNLLWWNFKFAFIGDPFPLFLKKCLGQTYFHSLQCANYCKRASLLSWRYPNLKLTWALWIMCLMLHDGLTTAESLPKRCLPEQWFIPRHRTSSFCLFPPLPLDSSITSLARRLWDVTTYTVLFPAWDLFLEHFSVCFLCRAPRQPYFSGGRVMCSLCCLRIVCCVSGWRLDVSPSAGFACVFLLIVNRGQSIWGYLSPTSASFLPAMIQFYFTFIVGSLSATLHSAV